MCGVKLEIYLHPRKSEQATRSASTPDHLAPPRMADGDSNLTTPAGTSSLVTKAVCSNLDWHDRWNLLAIGSLNVAHCAWWCSLLPEHLLGALFCADVGYICGDLAWIALVPGCVPPGARPTLLLHHVLTCCCAPVAMGRPVLMAHLLRAWIVELHSWNHIAARQLVRAPRLRRVLQARPCHHLCTPCHHLPLSSPRADDALESLRPRDLPRVPR